MNIEIVTTPNMDLNETGFGSRLACYTVLQALLAKGHQVGVSICINSAELDLVIKGKPDIIISAIKYILLKNGNKLWLSEYCESKGISFTGSPRDILLYDSDKVLAKQQVSSCDIATANFFTALPNEYQSKQSIPLPFPLFIKPTCAANSSGIDHNSLVYNMDAFKHKVRSIYSQYAEPALVEEYLSGREFTVAIIEDFPSLIVAAIEIIPKQENGIRILDASMKKNNTETLKPIKEQEILDKVMDIAERSFRALGARDFGRIDIKMDNQGICHFIEANLVPGMKKGSSYFPEALKIAANLSYEEVVVLMIQGAVYRGPSNKVLTKATNTVLSD